MKNIVYGLTDSRNDLVYYVGKSSVGDKRALEHLTKSHSNKVNDWIQDVKENWGQVKVILIEEVEELGFLAEREQYWISHYSGVNDDILNVVGVNKVLNPIYSEEDGAKFEELISSMLFLGEIIKKRRLVLNISQRDLCKASGIARSTLSLIENNNDTNSNSIKKVLRALTKINIDKKFNKMINECRVS